MDAETVLQPSLHSGREFTHLVLDEASARDIDVADLESSLSPSEEWDDEVVWTVIDRLHDHGYTTVYENDSFLIWPKDCPLPDEWAF
jgi:hypothetical protein